MHHVCLVGLVIGLCVGCSVGLVGGPRAMAEEVDAAETSALVVSNVFGDHMVLQREKPVPVWGRRSRARR